MEIKEKIKRGVNVLFPFAKPAKDATEIPREVAEITFDELKKLGERAVPRSPAPRTFADAQVLFREAAARQNLDANRLAVMQIDLDRRWIVIFFAGIVSFAIGIAGVILLVIDGLFPAIGYASSLCITTYSMASLLRTNLRRSQVRARALVTLKQYRHAAGSTAAMLFNDVRLTASNTTCSK